MAENVDWNSQTASEGNGNTEERGGDIEETDEQIQKCSQCPEGL